uniref:Uncharacterized protein n=1 Tax=Terrapene triunguis TaxID=2587831 RepID=A0A674J774_9SAUR
AGLPWGSCPLSSAWTPPGGKNKDQPKERGKSQKWKRVNGHQLAPGTFSSFTSCSLCAKPLVNKNEGKTSLGCGGRALLCGMCWADIGLYPTACSHPWALSLCLVRG